MTFPVTDANGNTVQILSAAETQALFGDMSTKLSSILTAVSDATPASVNILSSALPAGAATDATAALSAPADNVFAITPSDSTALTTIPKALLVTAAGTLSVKGTGSTAVSLGTVAVGALLPIRARTVMATGTTATVVGLA